jgi:ribose transport system permease protein
VPRNTFAAALRYSQFILLLLIVTFLMSTSANFRTWDNISNVLMQQSPFLLIISMGMTMAIITKGLDLSMGSNLALSSCVAAFFIKDGQTGLGVAAALIVGAGVGLLNGVLITRLRLVPFIATYTMDMVLRGLAYLFMGGTLFYGFSESFRTIGTGGLGPFSNLLLISLAFFGALFYLLGYTTFGRSVYTIGFNVEAARLSGINTARVLCTIYAINGLLAASAGLLYIARLNAAEATIGMDFTIKMFAATLIGGTPFTGGRGGVGNTLIGVLIMMFLANGMNLGGLSSFLQDAVFGAVIIISLFGEYIGARLEARA